MKHIQKSTFRLALVIFMLAFISLANAQSVRINELFVAGNKAYEQKDFETAIQRYQDVLNYEIEHPALYFNLANAYFKTGQLGPAILYYEKAHRLAPRDADVLENLELARMLTVDKVERPTPGLIANLLSTFYQFFSLNELAYLTLFHLIGIMILACLIVLIRAPFAKRVLWYFTGFGIALFIVFAVTFYIKADTYANQPEAIVLTPKLDAYNSPVNTGEVAFTIHEGKKVEILQKREGWYKIMLENDWQGWVEENKLGVI